MISSIYQVWVWIAPAHGWDCRITTRWRWLAKHSARAERDALVVATSNRFSDTECFLCQEPVKTSQSYGSKSITYCLACDCELRAAP